MARPHPGDAARTVKIVLAAFLPLMPSWNEGQSMSSGRRRGHYDMTIETWRASTIRSRSTVRAK